MIQEAEVQNSKIILSVNGITSATANGALFVPPYLSRKYRVIRAAARWHTASTSGKLQLEVAGKGIALASGVNQLDAGLDTSLTADTTITQPVSKPTIFGSESSLNLIVSGTMTSLADCTLTVELERVQ